MAFPKGPTAETSKRVNRVVQAAGKGRKFIELREKTGFEDAVLRYTIKVACRAGKLAKTGRGPAVEYSRK
jgi:hypothetical protein